MNTSSVMSLSDLYPSDLLSNKFPGSIRRGVLIELSAPSCMLERLDELQEKIQTTDSRFGATLFFDFKLENYDPSCFNSERKGQNAIFARHLSKIWEEAPRITDALLSGSNVVVRNYVFELLIHGYANDCFDVRRMKDQIAMSTLLSFLKALPQPDLVLSFWETPEVILRSSKIKFEELFPGYKDDFSMIEENAVYTKEYKREDARELAGRVLDNVRQMPNDATARNIHSIGALLATKVSSDYNVIKYF